MKAHMVEIKSFAKLNGAEFDQFLTEFCRVQDNVRVPPFRRGLLPSPVWIGFMCQPSRFAKEFWLASDGLGRCIGRIGASVSAGRLGEGAIGFFEVDLKHPMGREAGAKLLSAAEQWLKANSVKLVHGPMNFNFWYQYRFFQAESGDAPAVEPGFLWEPVQPPEYLEIWRDNGYGIALEFATREYISLQHLADKTRAAFVHTQQNGIVFRALDSSRILDVDIRALYEISLESLKDSRLFEPIAFEEFRALYISLTGGPDLGLAHLALDQDSKPVAFVICFEDQERAVFRRRACLPSHHGQNLIAALTHVAAEKALARGLTRYVTALERSKSKDEIDDECVRERRYVLLEKLLT